MNAGDGAYMNGPCTLHGRFDCLDCCPELFDYEDEAQRLAFEEGRVVYLGGILIDREDDPRNNEEE